MKTVFSFMAIGAFIVLAAAHTAGAFSALSVKLPYAKGERFIVVQGYDSPPTHINKDLYALDFSQDGCDAYGKAVVAASSGNVTLAEDTGYNGGYGTQVIVADGGTVVSRYAHMIPGSLTVSAGDAVLQGENLGLVGDTGLVAGMACPAHPGTHVHFAMYDAVPDGSFLPHNPEPISGYTNMTAGDWYLSDNGPPSDSAANGGGVIGVAGVAPAPAVVVTSTSLSQAASATGVPTGGVSQVVAPVQPLAPSAAAAQNEAPAGIATSTDADATTTSTTTDTSTSTADTSASTTATSTNGTATTTTDDDAASSTQDFLAPPQAPVGAASFATFNSSSLAVDFAWQAPVASAAASTTDPSADQIEYKIFDLTTSIASSSSSTVVGSSTLAPIADTTSTNFSYPVTQFNASDTFGIEAIDDAAGTVSALATTTVPIPDWSFTIQPDDSQASTASFLEDNWYDLGTGFYGTIRALTLEGLVSSPQFFASHLSLQEFLDPAYSELNQQFTISDNAPFAATDATVTIGGLNIPLQPNKYYRLYTYQDYQNRSVILKGTTATGTAMWNTFVYGTGRVETYYPFYPYLSVVMIPDYPPLAPPNPPVNIETNFDQFGLRLNASWPAATDPDTTSSLLTYEFNYSTSTSLNDDAWQSVGKNLSATIPVVPGNAYILGVRAVDDFGAMSAPILQAWNFPSGFSPYIIGNWVSSFSQDFTLTPPAAGAVGTVASIDVFADDFQMTSPFVWDVSCTLSLFDMASSTPALIAQAANSYDGGGCVGDMRFSFASSSPPSPALAAAHPYRWTFTAATNNSTTQALVRLYGTSDDRAEGSSSDPALMNAKFTVTGADGATLFAN